MFRIRASATVVGVAGLASAAAAQPTINYTLDWIEVIAGTSTPVPAPNGQMDPGEGVRVRLTATITPGIGSTATYTPPPPPGVGTVVGLGSTFLDLQQTGAFGGTWSNLTRAPGFALGSAGTGNPDGSLSALSAGQFVPPGAAANPTNPIVNLWQGTWTPASYAVRWITFQTVPAAASGGQHSTVLLRYSPDPQDPLVPVSVGANFGFVRFGIPAPGAAPLLLLAAAAAVRRRR